MSGTYQGTWHGGNDFSNETVEQVQQKLGQTAAANIAAALSASGQLFSLSGSGPGNGTASSSPSGVVASGGPGVPSVGGGLSVGPGSRVVVKEPKQWRPAWMFTLGDHVLKEADPARNTFTAVTYAGMDVDPNRGFSDVQLMEQRYGDSELWSTIDGSVARAADAWQTWSTKGVPFVKSVGAGAVNAVAGLISNGIPMSGPPADAIPFDPMRQGKR